MKVVVKVLTLLELGTAPSQKFTLTLINSSVSQGFSEVLHRDTS